jgi:hypothetical protein
MRTQSKIDHGRGKVRGREMLMEQALAMETTEPKTNSMPGL